MEILLAAWMQLNLPQLETINSPMPVVAAKEEGDTSSSRGSDRRDN